MRAVASPGDDGGFAYADPLPYLEIINEQIQATGHEPLFSEEIKEEGYDLTKAIDFRDWPIIDQEGSMDFPDGMFDVPAARIRVIGEKDGVLVHACYEKVLQPIQGRNYTEIMALAQQPHPFKWHVTHRTHSYQDCSCPSARLTMLPGCHDLFHKECGRFRKSKVDGPLDEHIESLTLAPPDEMYNGFYPTLPGNDVAHINPGAPGMDEHREGKALMGSVRLDNQNNVIGDAQPIRGGKEIRGGRAEHRRSTKGLIAWDSGTQAHLDRLKSQEENARKAKNRERVEKILAQAPPSAGLD